MRRDRVIFLVDDNPDDVDLTLRAFKSNKIQSEFIVARDGEEALEYLFATARYANRDPTVLPELVLLDLNLPRLDGLEVLRAIRADARTRRLPVVVLTCSNEDRDIAASYDLGANSFVRKPIDYMHFLEAARQLGTYWLTLNQVPSPTVSIQRS